MEKTNRRRFLKYVGGALLLASAGVGVLRTRGYSVSPEREATLKSLSPWQLIVVQHAARRIAAADDVTPAAPSPDDLDVAGFVDAYIARLPATVRRDLLRLLAYVEHLAPIARGYSSRFSRLGPDDQDGVLANLEASDQSLLRGGFAGLKALVFMGYYRNPSTWKILGYDGPWVNRPEKGWSQ